MAADTIITALSSLMGGISSAPPDQDSLPRVVDLLDQRCGGSYERVIFTEVEGDKISFTPSMKLFYHVGNILSYQVSGFALIGDQLLLRTTMGDVLVARDGTATEVEIPEATKTFIGVRGSVTYLDYPGPGCFYMDIPGRLPSFNATYPVPSKIVFQQENSSHVYGVHAVAKGLVAFGSRMVSYWLTQELQAHLYQLPLTMSGVLSPWAWAGSNDMVFWIGQDKNLYLFDGKKITPMGFAWLWANKTRAWMTFIQDTQDLFITLDSGTGDTFTNPVTYLYHKGMTRLSEVFHSPIYTGVDLRGVDSDGNILSMNLPANEIGNEYNWEDYVPAIVPPTREPDLITGWADFYSQQIKIMTGMEIVSSPCWPTYVKVESDQGGTASEAETSYEFPIAEFSSSGRKYRLSFWFPDIDAGPARITGLRAHLKGDDLRGLFAAAANQSSGG